MRRATQPQLVAGVVTCQSHSASYPKDSTGFDAFVHAELRSMVGYVMAAGADRERASDAVQEALTEAFATWSTIDRPGGWVRTAAVRHFVRALLRDRNRVVRELDGSLQRTAAKSAESAESTVVRVMESERALGGLPSQQRETFVLHLAGCPMAEIARRMGVADATVRSHLRHARASSVGRGSPPAPTAAPPQSLEGGSR